MEEEKQPPLPPLVLPYPFFVRVVRLKELVLSSDASDPQVYTLPDRLYGEHDDFENEGSEVIADIFGLICVALRTHSAEVVDCKATEEGLWDETVFLGEIIAVLYATYIKGWDDGLVVPSSDPSADPDVVSFGEARRVVETFLWPRLVTTVALIRHLSIANPVNHDLLEEGNDGPWKDAEAWFFTCVRTLCGSVADKGREDEEEKGDEEEIAGDNPHQQFYTAMWLKYGTVPHLYQLVEDTWETAHCAFTPDGSVSEFQPDQPFTLFVLRHYDWVLDDEATALATHLANHPNAYSNVFVCALANTIVARRPEEINISQLNEDVYRRLEAPTAEDGVERGTERFRNIARIHHKIMTTLWAARVAKHLHSPIAETDRHWVQVLRPVIRVSLRDVGWEHTHRVWELELRAILRAFRPGVLTSSDWLLPTFAAFFLVETAFPSPRPPLLRPGWAHGGIHRPPAASALAAYDEEGGFHPDLSAMLCPIRDGAPAFAYGEMRLAYVLVTCRTRLMELDGGMIVDTHHLNRLMWTVVLPMACMLTRTNGGVPPDAFIHFLREAFDARWGAIRATGIVVSETRIWPTEWRYSGAEGQHTVNLDCHGYRLRDGALGAWMLHTHEEVTSFIALLLSKYRRSEDEVHKRTILRQMVLEFIAQDHWGLIDRIRLMVDIRRHLLQPNASLGLEEHHFRGQRINYDLVRRLIDQKVLLETDLFDAHPMIEQAFFDAHAPDSRVIGDPLLHLLDGVRLQDGRQVTRIMGPDALAVVMAFVTGDAESLTRERIARRDYQLFLQEEVPPEDEEEEEEKRAPKRMKTN